MSNITYLWCDRNQQRVPVQDRVMFCPLCKTQHVDEGEWSQRPHKTHECQKCGHLWSPANHYTRGV